jgi:hypothetical protein
MELANIPPAVLSLVMPYLEQGSDALTSAAPKAAADLEISLHRRDGQGYSVEMRFTPPGSQAEMRLGSDALVAVNLDKEALGEAAIGYDWQGYGQDLSDMLFAPQAVKLAFGQAVARSAGNPLRLRLLFGPTAQDLHSLYWETLANPLDDTLLAANQNILFSRYLASAELREVEPRPKSGVRALVAIANPAGLDEYGMTPVDVAGEVSRAEAALKGTNHTVLRPEGERCTLAGLVRRLQDGYDILYLVAHGSVVRGQAWLWLENDEGAVQRISGAELAAQVNLLERPPLLAVLASCESAGKGEGDALQAFGPTLGVAGIPAVIAMQGKITMESVGRGMPVFFEKLLQNGRVDRALASARAALAAGGAPDYWMPALFMRLKDGAIWKQPEQTAPAPLVRLWSAILEKFQAKAAAQGALEDLLEDPGDSDNRDAFSIQLKKVLKEDPQLANLLSALIEEIQKAAGKGGSGGVNIQVGGNVGGSIVVGNNNTLGG